MEENPFSKGCLCVRRFQNINLYVELHLVLCCQISMLRHLSIRDNERLSV